MLFSARISTRRLAELCRRLATATEAGIDARTVWTREAERARGRARRPLGLIRDAARRGQSLAEALDQTGPYFPELLRALAAVGEETGHQAEVFAQLAQHYEAQVERRREFLAIITWPLIQLALALGIVGLLIWVMGMIQEMTGNRQLDPLGLGLVGNLGLAIYAGVLAAAAAAVFLAVQALRRGWLWAGPVRRLVLRLPILGSALHTLGLARLAWTMHLTMRAGMEVRRAMRLSFQTAGDARLDQAADAVDAQLARGNSIEDAFRTAGGFPHDFLDALAVAEQSGKLVESLGLLSRQYEERARAALATLTKLAGFAVWAAIAALIVVLIFRLFGFYIGQIYQAMEP
jgi:type II secretory pathway component PulF